MNPQLPPQALWDYFYSICKIPRASGKEAKILAFLIDFANTHGLEYKQDGTGNLLICKPASSGCESAPALLLQSHVDMVCEKNSQIQFNFDTDPIVPVIEGEWMKAKDTTLGADNGIGVAAQLAILADRTLTHGPLECLFTVEEETGLNGALGLEPDFFKSQVLINLDSEDEGELFIGCAGGLRTVARTSFTSHKPKGDKAYKIKLYGLKGGHSGDQIDKGFANANKLLARVVMEAMESFQLARFEGGNKSNAIPREAWAIVVGTATQEKALLDLCAKFQSIFAQEYAHTEPTVALTAIPCPMPGSCIANLDALRFLKALSACVNGVFSMSFEMPGLVETSSNLAAVRWTENHCIEILTSQRSAIESKKTEIAQSVRACFELADMQVESSDAYPGWAPKMDSQILQIAKTCYEKRFGSTPVIRAIHAGLECGLFLEKYPYLDMISFGPTIYGVHSPDERIWIPTVEKFWQHLTDVLQEIGRR